MNPTRPDSKISSSELGDLLRYWRDVRGMSQLDLSLETGVSQRQISFIESGRSVPGRNTLLTLAQTLEVPLRERNALLLAAGYAPLYSEAPWNAHEMQSVVRALERVVRQHEPYPAMVMDRHWNVLMTNDAAPRFFDHFIDMSSRQGPRNMLHLIFDPQGMRPFVADWDNVCRSLLQRVYRESVGHVIDDGTGRLLDELLAYPDVPRDWKAHHAPSDTSDSPPCRSFRWASSARARASLFFAGDERWNAANRGRAGTSSGMHVPRRRCDGSTPSAIARSGVEGALGRWKSRERGPRDEGLGGALIRSSGPGRPTRAACDAQNRRTHCDSDDAGGQLPRTLRQRRISRSPGGRSSLSPEPIRTGHGNQVDRRLHRARAISKLLASGGIS